VKRKTKDLPAGVRTVRGSAGWSRKIEEGTKSTKSLKKI